MFFLFFFFLHYNSSTINHAPTQNSMSQTSAPQQTTPTDSNMVGATILDTLNDGLDQIMTKIISPYLGMEDTVDFLEPSPYYYLPTEYPTY